MTNMVVCPLCNGDGKETCNNPDHGFINMAGGDLQRIGCPCCGHDEDHKVPNGGDCDVCNGTGEVTEEEGMKYLDEYDIDKALIPIENDNID